MSDLVDVAIIGAGMAGLSAAHELARAGKTVLVLEAKAHSGGRIISQLVDDSLTVELGAEFVHGKPEPTLALAREAGIELVPLAGRHFGKLSGRFVELKDTWAPLADTLARLKPNEADESARSFLDRQPIDADTRERFRQLVEGFEAAPIDEVSIQSLAADSSSMSGDDSQFRVRGGYGTLVDYLERSARQARADLRFEAPVARVHLEANGTVLLDFARALPSLRARACIVTVPLGVLQSEQNGGMQFDPPIRALAEQLRLLAMGHACRVGLRFDAGFALERVPRGATFFHEPTLPFETFWLQATARAVLWTTWAGGPKAQRLAAETRERRQRLALGALANLLDVDIERLDAALLSSYEHDFSNDPYARGAYSFMRPGGTNAAKALSEPFGRVLFIAGEATDHQYPGTVAGALASGERAARQALAALE